MGIVYRALDPAIGRTIAIKSIRLSDLTDAGERERLRDRLFREAQSAGILSHPNIVTIYDILEDGGCAYIFMELVNGPPLEKLLSSESAPDKNTLLGILRQTAAALDYAHRRGIIHRDIKPANIMIHDDGAAKITDFGVAKIASQQMTQSGTIMGTPSYMSPEQVQGGDISGRADQFALGVIAYEILTGERPFIADYLPSLLYKICRDDPAPVPRLNPTLGPEVDAVIGRALAKDPKERFPACVDFVDALERACNLRADWVMMARGSSLSMPTVSSARPPLEAPRTDPAARPVVAGATRRVLPAPVAPQTASAPVAQDPARAAREHVRLEDTESHTIRNIVLALASLLVIGLIVLLAQQWSAPKQAATVAENAPAESPANPEGNKPSPKGPETSPPATAPVKEQPAAAPDADPAKPAPDREEPVLTKPARPALPLRTPPPVSDVTAQILTSPPGARVLVDGNPQLACRAPCTLTLPTGRHTLLARADGYRDANRIFELPRDSVLSVDMDRNGGTLSITSNMTGSSIFINGQERPEKTPAILNLPIGSYQVRLVNGKLQCDTDLVRIQDGSIARRSCDMQ